MLWGKAQRSDDSAGALPPPRCKALSAMLRRFGGLIGVAVLALSLGACSGPEEADPDPLESIEVDPPDQEGEPEPDPANDGDADDDEPGPVEYEHPVPAAEIDDDGQAGAEAAAVYFMELFSYSYATGDLASWDEISADDCEFCAVVRDQVSNTYEDGGFVETEPPTIGSTTSEVWASSPGDFVVNLTVALAESRHFDAEGLLDETFPSAEVRSWVLVEHEQGSWVVLGAEAEDL